jgi:hypothetical protein
VIVKPTDVDGVENIHRAEGEPPIAQLTAPKAMPPGCRDWGIRYRDGRRPDDPFGDGSYNATPTNRAQALAEIARTIRVCNEYQLGLSDCPK